MQRSVTAAVRVSLVLVLVALAATLGVGLAPAQEAAAANERWCPPQAAPYCAENAFLDLWREVDRQTGGYALDIIGFPISFTYLAPAGIFADRPMIVQFYERAIFEWHPENPLQYQVLLTRLGAEIVANDADLQRLAAQPPVPCENQNTCAIFPATNHTLRGSFGLFWLGNGGLPVFGYPLTEVFPLEFTNGQVYQAQYFERNRFEAHPENTNPRYQVLLGRLGAEVYNLAVEVIRTWPVVRTPNYGER